MHSNKLWEEIVTRLSEEVDPKSLATWFDNVRLKEVKKDAIVIEAPNKFVSNWIKKNYNQSLSRAAGQVFGKSVSLKFEQNPELEQEPATSKEQAPAKASARKKQAKEPHPELNPKYTFENFMVGSSNQFAHAACMAVAEKRAKKYNPLFIYGGVGLGKTHLLNAVGNHIYNGGKRDRIICIQAENFMNEMINAIREEKMPRFRNRYRKECGVLLMDDIEILAGKERTQEEFFYTFNDLYSAGKTIVITSDKFPKEMTTLEERLRSRFESGIIVDIQPPEFETSLAILKHKAHEDQIHLPDDVAVFLAERIRSNVRKLEGSLIRLSALSSISGSPITVELAEEVIRAILDEEERRLTIETIMKTVASYFNIKVSELKSSKRNRKYAGPRQIAMYLSREFCKLSFPEIGQAFGGRDHSTVIHSWKKVGIEKNVDKELKRHIDSICRQMKVSK